MCVSCVCVKVCTRMLCAPCQPFVCPINEAVVVGVGGGVSGPARLPGSILSCCR